MCTELKKETDLKCKYSLLNNYYSYELTTIKIFKANAKLDKGGDARVPARIYSKTDGVCGHEKEEICHAKRTHRFRFSGSFGKYILPLFNK